MNSNNTTIQIQKVETFDKIVFRPYLVRKSKFLWWRFEKYFSIQKWENGSFVYPDFAEMSGLPSVECKSEEEAILTAKDYIKFVCELHDRYEFGTKITTESEFALVDNEKEGVVLQKIEPEQQ